MLTVAIETATIACALGVASDGHTVTRVVDHDRHHTETLIASLATMVSELGARPRDITTVVVDRGPGLFTGLRVGVATARALADAVGATLIGVTALDLYAHGAQAAGVRGDLLCAVDGRRGEIFVQRFALSDDAVTAADEPSVARPRETVITWATNGAPITFTGDGVARYLTDFAAVPNGTVWEATVPPVAVALGWGATQPADPVTPLYLRDADAVANFTTRDQRG